ncbi:MAG: hypothetical protein FJX61_16880 [Alphaproteobacteria bacterium]|nr:hypothetical protein [Alphaproteobacteria bacterium]
MATPAISSDQTAPLATESPELSVFDVAAVRLQTYWTEGGDGMVIVRIEDASGRAVISASLFGAAAAGRHRLPPRIETGVYDERAPQRRADVLPAAERGGLVRYLIVGDSEAAVRAEGEAFRHGWGFAYDPIVGEPYRQSDGKWVSEASRAAVRAAADIRCLTHVEVAIVGRDDALTRPASLGLSRAFDRLFDADDIAGPIGWSDVNRLRRELIARHRRRLRRPR